MKRALFLSLLLPVTLLLPPAAQAHKISVFAWPEGGLIRGEVKFDGGRQAKHVRIALRTATDGAALAETACDEQGAFRFALPEQALKTHPDLLLVANAGEGHQGEWRLAGKEYAAAPALPAASEQQLRRIVAEELSKGLSPVRRTLAECLNPEPGLRDILGGIGWIIGLAGLAAWVQGRRRRNLHQSSTQIKKRS